MFAFLVLSLVSCRSDNNMNMSEEVKKQLERGATEVNFDRTADFRWEFMQIGGPSFWDKETCDVLKFPDEDCTQGYYGLMFVKRDRSVEIKTLLRRVANFDERCLNKPIRRNATTFAVERRPAVYLVCRSGDNRP
jgi:hypothetical protein